MGLDVGITPLKFAYPATKVVTKKTNYSKTSRL